MTRIATPALHRRRFLASSAALGVATVAGAAAAQAIDPYTGQPLQGAPAAGATPDAGVVQFDTQDNRRNQSSFRMHDWQPFFDNLTNGAILVDFTSRALSFWSEDQTVFRLYPTSIPVSEDLTRKGRTDKSGVQFSLSLIALKALPVLMLGGFTSIPGAIVGGLIIGVGEKLFEYFVGPLVGGATEAWFAYVLALLFLVFRPQGLFGEKIIERV